MFLLFLFFLFYFANTKKKKSEALFQTTALDLNSRSVPVAPAVPLREEVRSQYY